MKKRVPAFLLAILLIALSAAAVAETEIIVNGDGSAMISANIAIVTLGVTAQEKDVIDAQAKVNSAIENIRNALILSGVEKENINTDSIRIYARYDYSSNIETIAGYNASSSLAIRTTDMEKIGSIIDIAFSNGANTLDGIEFSNDDTSDAEKEALTLAVQDAVNKANIITEAAGLTVKGITTITESYSYARDSGLNAFYKNEAVEDSVTAGAPTVVQSAKLLVTAQISIVFVAE